MTGTTPAAAYDGASPDTMEAPVSLRTPLRALTATAAVLALALSGCGTDPGDRVSQPAGVQDSRGAEAAGFAKVDAALVPGLVPTVYTDEPRGVRAETPIITTSRQMTSAMEVLRERGLREAAWEQASKVDIAYQVIASGPGILGIVVTPTWVTESGDRTKPALVWYDAATKRVFSSPVLVSETAWAPFTEAVVKASKRVDKDKLRQALASDAAPQGDGPMLGFDADGHLIAQFAAGVVRDEPVAVRVKADTAAPFLSDFGRRAAEASQSPSVFDGTPPPGSVQTTPAASATPGERDSADSVSPGSSASSDSTATPGSTASPARTATSPAVTTRAPGQRPSTAVGPDCTQETCVALTYDDGPGAETPTLVKSLVDAKAPATFFQLGQMVQANPEIGKQVASAGNEIGAHSYSHPNLAQQGDQRLHKEVGGTARILEEVYGRKPMIFRPPYGAHNKQVREVVRRSGAAIIQWDADTMDWKTRSTTQTVDSAVHGRAVQSGSIILMHDIHPSTVAAAPAIVDGLQKKGVTLVTVSELSLNGPGYQAGKAYCNITTRAQNGFDCAA